MIIPTEVVGSLPRPTYLQHAFAAYDAGKISRDELVAVQDRAAEDSIKRMEETGEMLVTDGEQRASSFATYPIIDTLSGAGLADNLKADGQYFAIFDDGKFDLSQFCCRSFLLVLLLIPFQPEVGTQPLCENSFNVIENTRQFTPSLLLMTVVQFEIFVFIVLTIAREILTDTCSDTSALVECKMNFYVSSSSSEAFMWCFVNPNFFSLPSCRWKTLLETPIQSQQKGLTTDLYSSEMPWP